MPGRRDSGQWTFVTHKNSRKPWGKKGQRKAKQRDSQTPVPVIKGVLPDKGGYPSLCKRTKTAINEMKSSQLYFELINHFQHCVLNQKEHFESYISLMSEQSSNEKNNGNGNNNNEIWDSRNHIDETSFDAINVSIICYGLGNFSKTHASMSQLALLVALRDFVNSYQIDQESNIITTNKKEDKNDNSNNSNNSNLLTEDIKQQETANKNNNDNNNNNNVNKKHVFSWEKNKISKEKSDEKRKLFEKYPFRLKSIEFYEPILTSLEEKILKNLLNINVLTNDTNGFYSLNISNNKYNEILLCYMPHCPKLLYNNILYSNWTQSQLSKLFIIGNSFAQYSELAQCVSKSERWNMNYILACNQLGVTIEDSLNQWLPGQNIYCQTGSTNIIGTNNNGNNNNDNNDNVSSSPMKKANNSNNSWKNKRFHKKFRKRRKQHATYNNNNNGINDKNFKSLDQQTQKQLSLTGQAFAFQTFQYFGIRQILRCDNNLWQQMSLNLKKDFETGYQKFQQRQNENNKDNSNNDNNNNNNNINNDGNGDEDDDNVEDCKNNGNDNNGNNVDIDM